MTSIEHISAHSFHGRKGSIRNAFRYAVDYVMLDPAHPPRTPILFGLNRAGVLSLHRRDNGGAVGGGTGVDWVKTVLKQQQIDGITQILLLTQPRFLGFSRWNI